MATTQRSRTRSDGNTLVSVLAGAAVAFVLSSFAPLLAQVVGGGVAGYLQKAGTTEGAKVGAIASVVSSIPGLLLLALFVPFVFLPFLGGDLAAGALFSGVGLVFILGVLVFSIVSAAVLGAVGGYVGAAMEE